MTFGDRVRAVFGMAPRRLEMSATARPIDDVIRDFAEAIGKVTRPDALSVPAVKRGRDVICAISTFPLEAVDLDNRVVEAELLEQLDENTTNVVVLAQILEDLLFDAVSYVQVTDRDVYDYPAKIRRLDPGSVSPTPPKSLPWRHLLPSGVDPRDVLWVEGKPVGKRDVKRFDSPNTPLLRDGSRVIRRALALDRAAEMFAENPRAQDFFTPADPNVDPGDDPAIQEALTLWASYRKRRVTGYVPAALKYNQVQQPTPVDLQLMQLQQRAAADVANVIGLSPEDVGVSTTSRTYANDVDRRKDRLNDLLNSYILAITQRLSMPDITPPGRTVRANTDNYLQPDPKTRAEVQLMYLAQGATDLDEIRDAEGKPRMPQTPAGRPTAVIPATVGRPVDDSVPAAVAAITAEAAPRATFAGEVGLSFDGAADKTFSVDTEARTITGLAVPYNQTASKGGRRYRFARGALKYASVNRVKLLRDHDTTQPLGKAIRFTETPDGLVATFKIAAGPAGDAALALAAEGVLDGLSVGVNFRDEDLRPDPIHRGALLVLSAALREVSLLAVPAFDDSRLTSVRASADERTGMHNCEHCGAELTPGVAHTCPVPANIPATAPVPAAVSFTAEQVAWMQSQGLGGRPAAATPPPPAHVDPTPRPAAVVTEAAPYRFDADGNLQPGTHDFGIDLIRGLNAKFNDPAARARAESWVEQQFASENFVVTTDVNELNPTINTNRYIDQREFRSPVWERINKGAPPNGVQPFSWPSFSSASGLVGAHTEGVEPTAGTFVTTNQTVTPTATSGKAKISRETWDMGGTPGIGNLIWRQMTRGYFEALEAKAIAVLDAATPTAIALTAGGGTTGQTLASELVAAFARLQFVRGGFSMDSLFAQIDLYLALVGAKTTDGAYLFPALGPSNRDGTVRTRFGAVDINGVVALPSWALAATGSVPASSYLFDSMSVDGWATPPRQLMMPEIEVANVYMGIWGYSAAAINDITGVREITYDPVP